MSKPCLKVKSAWPRSFFWFWLIQNALWCHFYTCNVLQWLVFTQVRIPFFIHSVDTGLLLFLWHVLVFQIHLCSTGRFTPWSSLQNVFHWCCVRIRLPLARWTWLLTVLGPDELGWSSGGKFSEVSLCLDLYSLRSCKFEIHWRC